MQELFWIDSEKDFLTCKIIISAWTRHLLAKHKPVKYFFVVVVVFQNIKKEFRQACTFCKLLFHIDLQLCIGPF